MATDGNQSRHARHALLDIVLGRPDALVCFWCFQLSLGFWLSGGFSENGGLACCIRGWYVSHCAAKQVSQATTANDISEVHSQRARTVDTRACHTHSSDHLAAQVPPECRMMRSQNQLGFSLVPHLASVRALWTLCSFSPTINGIPVIT